MVLATNSWLAPTCLNPSTASLALSVAACSALNSLLCPRSPNIFSKKLINSSDNLYHWVFLKFLKNKNLGFPLVLPLGIKYFDYSTVSNIFTIKNDNRYDNIEIIGLKFVLSLPTISSAISGMTNANEVRNNIRCVENIDNIITDEDDDDNQPED